MSGGDKQLELEALAAVGEMLLSTKPEATRKKPPASCDVRGFLLVQRTPRSVSELCNEAGSDATWRENIVRNCKTAEDLQAAEAVMQRIREGSEAPHRLRTLWGRLEAGLRSPSAGRAGATPLRNHTTPRRPWRRLAVAPAGTRRGSRRRSVPAVRVRHSRERRGSRPATPTRTPWPGFGAGWHQGANERRGRGLLPRQRLTKTVLHRRTVWL